MGMFDDMKNNMSGKISDVTNGQNLEERAKQLAEEHGISVDEAKERLMHQDSQQ